MGEAKLRKLAEKEGRPVAVPGRVSATTIEVTFMREAYAALREDYSLLIEQMKRKFRKDLPSFPDWVAAITMTGQKGWHDAIMAEQARLGAAEKGEDDE